MFGGKERNVRVPALPERRHETVIGPDSIFTGSLNGQGTVRVDGRFRGEMLTSDSLILGPTGDLEADVEVREAVIAGRVTGKLFASERVLLQTGSRVEGDIYTGSLMIEERVYFNGRCVMNDRTQTQAMREDQEGHHERPDLEVIGKK
jgi:cytoskeletal protein CcmA (bactofilin family)